MSKATGSNLKSIITVTDMFAGCGGSSQGMHNVPEINILQAMNHWELAIKSHNTNFPDTLHDCADVSQMDPRRYHTTTFLWASPECTNHSVSKGVKRRGAQLSLLDNGKEDPAAVRSRATMWDPIRFAEYHDYPFVIIENVVDARKWRLFDAWIQAWLNLGYDYKIVYLNSMFAHVRPLLNPRQDQYVPQSRDRMYVVLWKKGNPAPDLDIRPLGWCYHCETNVEGVQSWKNPRFPWGRYPAQYVYRCPTCANEVEPYHYAAFNAIDWRLPIERIGDRKRPLRKRTLDRIRAGLEKFGRQHLMIDLAHTHGHDSRAIPIIRSVGPTQTSAQTFGLLTPFVVETLFKGARQPRGVDEEIPTQTARQSMGLAFYLGYANGDGPPHDVTEPTLTLHAANSHGVVIPPLLTSVNYYDDRNIPVDDVGGTQTTAEKWGLTVPPFLTLHYSPGYSKGVDQPAGGVTAQDHHSLTVPPAFFAQLRNNQDAKDLVDGATTVTAGGTHHGLVLSSAFLSSYYSGSDVNHDVAGRVQTVTAKARHALVTNGEKPRVEDCGFRMLQPREIGAAMAFGRDYVVLGTKRDRVRQYGNAVTPPVATLLAQRCLETIQ